MTTLKQAVRYTRVGRLGIVTIRNTNNVGHLRVHTVALQRSTTSFKERPASIVVVGESKKVSNGCNWNGWPIGGHNPLKSLETYRWVQMSDNVSRKVRRNR